MQYKFSAEDVNEFVDILKKMIYQYLNIYGFNGNRIAYLHNVAIVHINAVKILLTPQSVYGKYGINAMENEIHSTLNIENIQSSRESIRRILNGYAPENEDENRIFGIKKGLEFIGDTENKITEENIYKLYQYAIYNSLAEDDKLLSGNLYRHDSVYIVGDKVEHTGLPHDKLPQYMNDLVSFIETDSNMDDLLKAAAIHFYISYLHPYFDGNGRMARLIHLWYLVQQGYPSTLFTPLSMYIEKSKSEYYNAFTLTEQNAKISGVIDITPFLVYFIDNVYNKLNENIPKTDSLKVYEKSLADGIITEKEKELWNFVLSSYGINEFSTKQLERDFGNAAYATIRGFVLKFEKLGLFTHQKYRNRVKYRLVN
ncbi:MAG: Fic family protein [Oscillospiraceae bacterium]|nr:Fic family protein [Oscillospiraceae bacterium]